jgi:hypothetical protein
MGFQWVKRVDCSNRLRKLEVVSEVLRKGDKRLVNFYFVQKGFFWLRRGGWGNSTHFQRVFLGEDGRMR